MAALVTWRTMDDMVEMQHWYNEPVKCRVVKGCQIKKQTGM